MEAAENRKRHDALAPARAGSCGPSEDELCQALVWTRRIEERAVLFRDVFEVAGTEEDDVVNAPQ